MTYESAETAGRCLLKMGAGCGVNEILVYYGPVYLFGEFVYISGGPLSTLTCCVNARPLSGN